MVVEERSALKKSYRFCFFEEQGYKPIMKANIIDKSFSIRKIIQN